MNKSSLFILLGFLSRGAKDKLLYESSFLNYELVQVQYIAASLEHSIKSKLHEKYVF